MSRPSRKKKSPITNWGNPYLSTTVGICQRNDKKTKQGKGFTSVNSFYWSDSGVWYCLISLWKWIRNLMCIIFQSAKMTPWECGFDCNWSNFWWCSSLYLDPSKGWCWSVLSDSDIRHLIFTWCWEAFSFTRRLQPNCLILIDEQPLIK